MVVMWQPAWQNAAGGERTISCPIRGISGYNERTSAILVTHYLHRLSNESHIMSKIAGSFTEHSQ